MSIVLEGLTKRYDGQLIVDQASVTIEEGELFVLLGASGSGKSTVLRLIAGLAMPDAGSVHLHGRDVTGLPPQERGIGFVFQNYSIFRHMSVSENVEFGLKIRQIGRRDRRQKRDRLLDLVGLAGLGHRYAHQLSGGQQQRVALARALAYEPSVLLLDEPFGALDVKIRGQLRRNLKEIQSQLGVTAILVTHDQEEAFELADRVGLMERGSLLEVGEPERLYNQPQTLFAATFLGAGTVLVGRARGGVAYLGPVALPIPAETPHEEDARVRVLFRPEQVEIVPAPAGPSGSPESLEDGNRARVLGRGKIVEESFAGALRRLRVSLPPVPGTRQVAPALAYGQEGLLVDLVVPAGEEPPEGDVWLRLKGWHILKPPRPRLLVCDVEKRESPALFTLAGRLRIALGASVRVLAVRSDAKAVEDLRTALPERAASLGLADPEIVLRAGSAAEEIVAEQRQSIYDFLLLPAPSDTKPDRAGGTLAALLSRFMTPLLVVHDRQGGQEGAAIARILICTAVGEPGKSDVRIGGWLARRLGAEVTLLHVLGEGWEPSALVKDHLERGVATLRDLEVRSSSTIRRARTPVQGILTEAAEGNYDLIVVGRHIRGVA
ncbi:MAG TPA: ATP-binding cassette domain-containing protein, partial [Thermoanaerobaculia bacterium]|nr:ATP-binding cassette domain-containing protein [Thermoanaerobaculia bacterium]